MPDITNKQVQINTIAPALSPAEIEKQITFPIETALAGTPGLESTRSLSRNGFSQVTAVFTERTDIYFARQQIGERLTEIRARLPQGIEPRIGPDLDRPRRDLHVDRPLRRTSRPSATACPACSATAASSRRTGRCLTSEIEKNAYLRTVQDWIIKPQVKMVTGVAGVDAIGGYLKQYQVNPDAAKLIALGLTFADVAKAIEANNVSRGARYIERNGEGIVVRSGGRLENIDELGAVVVTTRGGVPVRVRDLAAVSIGGETRTGSASENGREVVVGTALMLIGANSRTVSSAVDAKLRALAPNLAARRRGHHRARPHPACGRYHRHRRQKPHRGRAAGHRRAVSPARQFPRRADHGAGDPAFDADDRHRDVAGTDQRQPDEPRRARFRPDRGRCRHHHREQPAPSRREDSASSAAR